MKRLAIAGTLIVVCAAGCGKSEEQAQADELAKGAEQIAKGAEQVAAGAQGAGDAAQQGMQQMMQGLQQMAAGAQGNTKAVDFELLKALVPEFSGWTRSDVKGQQVSMGITVSSAEARYRKDDASIKLEIIDTSLNQMILAPFMMFAKAGYEERSDTGYKKGMTLAGHPGFETWERDGDAEVNLLVNKRFIVHTDGSGLATVEPARALAQAVDLSRLAALK